MPSQCASACWQDGYIGTLACWPIGALARWYISVLTRWRNCACWHVGVCTCVGVQVCWRGEDRSGGRLIMTVSLRATLARAML